MATNTTRKRAIRKAPAKTPAKSAAKTPERSTAGTKDGRSASPATPAVRFHHDGQPMPDSQNRLSSLAWGFTRGLDGERPRISVTDLRAVLADAGVSDVKSAWSVKLANGITLSAKIERPAKANGAKPAKATTRKRSTT